MRLVEALRISIGGRKPIRISGFMSSDPGGRGRPAGHIMTTPFQAHCFINMGGFEFRQGLRALLARHPIPTRRRVRLSSLVGLPPSSYGAIKTARHTAGSSASVSGGPGLAGCNDGAGCKAAFENQ